MSTKVGGLAVGLARVGRQWSLWWSTAQVLPFCPLHLTTMAIRLEVVVLNEILEYPENMPLLLADFPHL